jgi:hypothetical protein
MNNRIKHIAEQAGLTDNNLSDGNMSPNDLEKFAELILANLADELLDVARQSKKVNLEWANGVNHAAMLAQRMTMNLPQWPEAE